MNLFRRRTERPMNCMQVGRRLQRYLDGEIDDLAVRRIMRHLEQCRRCGMEAAAYNEIKNSLARHSHDLPGDALDRLRAFGQQLVDALPEGDDGPHQDASN